MPTPQSVAIAPPVPPRRSWSARGARSALRRGPTLAAVSLLALLVWPARASAEVAIDVAAGVFQPWTGDRGEEYRATALWSIGSKKQMRIGPEFSFRQFDTEYFGVTDIEVQSYRIGVVFHYRFLPEAAVQPYLGARYNFALNVIDGDRVEDVKPDKDVTDIGTGIGLAGIFGVDVPIGEHFAFFAETGLSVDVQLTEEDGNYDVENIGGVSGLGGIRVLF